MLFFTYLRNRLGVIALAASFCLIFAAITWLGGLALRHVLYALLLCACLGAAVAVFDYSAFRRRHYDLLARTGAVCVQADCLPPPAGQLEHDYQELIAAVYKSKAELSSASDKRYSALVDYYTTWAHQIKTPIAAMRLLLQAGGPDENPELTRELFRIEQYVEMVLQYLRMDSDSTDYVIRRCSLDGIICQALRKYASQFIQRRITLNYRHSDIFVLTDEKWLLFVIEQVLSNALKYTPEGSISITVEPNDTLVISDTGIGIAAEDLPRVFENSFTGYNGRSDKKSTGIGLFLCRRICSRLGHEISIASAPGKGTSVKICLERRECVTE